MGRVVFPLWGPLDRWWLPCYLRLKLELILTPIRVRCDGDKRSPVPIYSDV